MVNAGQFHCFKNPLCFTHSSPFPLETTDFLIAVIVFSSPKCDVVRVIYYAAFLAWLLS